MSIKRGRIFIMAMLALSVVIFFSMSTAFAKKKYGTSSGAGWNSWNYDDGSSGHKGHGKSHDDDISSGHSGHKHKKMKPKREWLTDGNKNIDHDKHFLGTRDEADLVIKTNDTEKARVTIDGDVGIGTASPTGTLHVVGGAAAAETDGKDVTIEAQDGGPTTGLGGNIVLTPGTDGDEASSGTVYVGEIDSLDPPMLTLDVNGQIRIRGGSPFLGAVLTSDSFGNASWQLLDINDSDADPTNELQTLSQSGNDVTLSLGGGTVTVADNDNDSSNEFQTLTQAGNNVTLSNGGGAISVDDGDSNPTNELQNLSSSAAGTSRTIDISGGLGATIDVADNDDDSTNELNTSAALNGNDLEITDAGGTLSVDLGSLEDDADPDPTNELNTSVVLTGTNLEVTDAGGTITTDLSTLTNEVDPEVGANTTNFMPKWDGSKLVTGTVFDNGTKVGIGTTSPAGKLHIGGWIGGGFRTWMDNGVIVGNDSDGGYFGVKDEGFDRKDTVITWGDNDQDNLRFIYTESPGPADGVEAMRINGGAGNVGIGTASPTEKLTVAGNVAPAANNSFNLGTASLRYSNLFLASNVDHSSDLRFKSGGSDHVTFTTTGNVGIGTTTPISNLTVRNPSIDWSEQTNLTLETGDPSRGRGAMIWQLESSDSNDDGGLHFATRDDAAKATVADSRMFIHQRTGNVGIGTSSPLATLDITGNIKIADGTQGPGEVLTTVGGSGLATWEPIANDGDWIISGSDMYSAVTGNVGIGTNNPSNILHLSKNGQLILNIESTGAHNSILSLKNTTDENQIYTDKTTGDLRLWNGSDLVTIEPTGNVGIGTTSPNSRLDIAGNIALSGSGTTITTANTDLVLEQTGDSFGTTRLFMQNRLGSGGALFENAGINLVDIGFKPNTGPQSNLRLERRAGFLVHAGNSNGEWQLIDDVTGSVTKTHAFGNSATIINSGNVGIGTTTPGFKLDVTGDINFTGGLFENGSPFVSSPWGQGGGNVFRSAGSVGIGTTSPIASLDVAGEVALTSNSARLRLMRETGTNFIDYEDSNAFGIRSMNIDNTNIVDRLKIDTLGRFAIGTTNTGNAKFVINDTNEHTLFRLENFNQSDESSMRFVTKTLNGSDNFHADIALKSTSNSGGIGYLGFKVPFNNSPGSGYDMVINNSGNVGIGTTTPQSKLSLGANLANTKLALWDNGAGGLIGLGIQNSTFRLHLNQASDAFRFYNAPAGSELMAVLGNGNVGIGTPSPGQKLHVNGNAVVTGTILGEATGAGDIKFGFNVANTFDVGNKFFVEGNGVVRGPGAIVWHNPSDFRWKKDITTIPNALDKVSRLRGVNFRWREGKIDDDSLQMGLVAQEVAEVVPEVVQTADDEMKTKAVKYEHLVGLLVEAIKELKAENDEIKDKFTTLADKHEAIVDMLLASSTDLPKEKLVSLIGKEKK